MILMVQISIIFSAFVLEQLDFAVLVPEVRLQRVDRVRAEVDEERPRLRILLEESKEAKTKKSNGKFY